MAVGDTKFEELNVVELRALAEQFAVDLDGKTRKADIIAEIKQMGVTWDMYAALLSVVEDEEVFEDEPVVVEEAVVVTEPAPVVEESQVLRMTRANPLYQIRGYEFTSDHPYALVKESDADYLIEVIGGFRLASPRELKEFYGV